jgi:prophage tail gpP-like protein
MPIRQPDQTEVATVVVEGREFDEWETVYVQIRWTDFFPTFQFTAAEGPYPWVWERLQFRPGERVGIYLARQLVMTGTILTRQCAFDAGSHAVQISGVGRTFFAARASIIDKTSNFDKMNFIQVAAHLLAPTGVGYRIVGELDNTPFEKLANEPGEPIGDFLEKIARPRGIIVGADEKGNFLFIGPHESPAANRLTEGENILKCNVIFTIENTRSDIRVRGQTAASDQQYGSAASEQESVVPGTPMQYSPILVPAEQPVWNQSEIVQRALNERIWSIYTILRATVVVYGWLKPNGALWRAGEKVIVYSPMAMLKDVPMKIQNVTYTQDSKDGTLTTLELVQPELLRDRMNLNPFPASGYFGADANVKPERNPAATPPAQKPDPPLPDVLPGPGMRHG